MAWYEKMKSMCCLTCFPAFAIRDVELVEILKLGMYENFHQHPPQNSIVLR